MLFYYVGTTIDDENWVEKNHVRRVKNERALSIKNSIVKYNRKHEGFSFVSDIEDEVMECCVTTEGRMSTGKERYACTPD